jgi:hypothetical protein
MRRWAEGLLFLAVVLTGAWLRLRNLAATSLWLDEILDYDIATRLAQHPTWRWWSVSREHGPLFFVTELAGRFATSVEHAARLPPALLGVTAIVVAWVAVRRSYAFATAAVFAMLLATSPLHVYYSREARPYALLMLIAVALLGAQRFSVIALLLFAAALTSATAAPLLLAVVIAFAAKRRSVSVAAIASLALVALLYRGNSGASHGTTLVSVDRLVQSFAMSALDSTAPRAAAYALALAAIIGSVVAIRRDRERGTFIVAMAILPVLIAIVALRAMGHWYSVRYISVALPAYLLLAAIGIVASARLVRQEWLAIVIAAALAREAWPAATTESLRKLDWRVVAATIREHAHDGDLVIAMNDWSYVSLEFYLRGVPLRIIDVREYGGAAANFVASNSQAWIVTAGGVRGDTNAWTCRYPVVLASPLESFRLHYAPSFAHLLQHRATLADRRAFAARFPRIALGFGPESDLFLTGGFGDAEGTGGEYGRWVIGTHASLILPSDAARDRRIAIRMLPLLTKKSQHATVALNGATIAELDLANEWREYTVDVPRTRWRLGANELTLTFAWAESPGTNDPRPLSAMLDELSLDGGAIPPKELTMLTHINSAGLLVDREVERHPRKPLIARDRQALANVMARLGVDDDHVRIEDAAALIAYESDCRSDAEFVALAYAILVDRRVEGVAAQHFLSQLGRGVSRAEIVRKIIDSGAMRAKLHAVAD